MNPSIEKDFRLHIAHISDLHFSELNYSPAQFFSKRWIGNLNFIFSRKKIFEPAQLTPLPSLFKEFGVDHVVISGDLSTTSLDEEFRQASQFINQLTGKGMSVFSLPGNHDHYTKSAYKNQKFYDFFNCAYTLEDHPIYSYNLKKHKVAAKHLGHKWWLISLDTALATSLVSSRGYFSPELEKNLEEVIALIPKDNSIILVNHFPFFNHESPRKALVRGESLLSLIRKHENIKLYLHGHTHQHCIADLRDNGLPIISDSGSVTHRKSGTWNLFEITPEKCEIKAFRWEDGWQQNNQATFTWK